VWSGRKVLTFERNVLPPFLILDCRDSNFLRSVVNFYHPTWCCILEIIFQNTTVSFALLAL